MIIQDIIRALKTETCPFCNKSMSCFADDRCYTCNRISYSEDHLLWEINGVEYFLRFRNFKIDIVRIETSSAYYVVFDAQFLRQNNKFQIHIDENVNLEDLYKIGNRMIKEEIFK